MIPCFPSAPLPALHCRMKSVAVLALASALLFPSCATEDEPIPVDKTGEMLRPKLVGRVATVPSDKRFVLIQSYGEWKVAAGSVLTTRGTHDRTANLLATGEAMGQYAAADVRAGEVMVGDAVYSREMIKPAGPEIPAGPENSTTPAVPPEPSPAPKGPGTPPIP